MSEAPAVDAVESVSSLPNGSPLDADAAAPPSVSSVPAPKARAPPPTPPSAPRASVLGALPSHTDAFLSHLHRAASTRAGADVVLLFLTYACRLSGAALEALSRSVLRHSARRLVALAFKLPPATTVVLSSAPAPLAATVALDLAARLRAAAGFLGEWRMMGRLWGLLGLYFAAKKLLVKSLSQSSEKDAEKDAATRSEQRFDTALAYAQTIALLSYQSAENIAFLSSKKVLGFSPATQAKLGRWSVRSWALYIGMELGRLLVERARKSGGGGVAAKDAAWAREWRTDFSRNLAWAPLTVHWSIDNGPLSEMAIALLAFYPASGHMRDLWRSTA